MFQFNLPFKNRPGVQKTSVTISVILIAFIIVRMSDQVWDTAPPPPDPEQPVGNPAPETPNILRNSALDSFRSPQAGSESAPTPAWKENFPNARIVDFSNKSIGDGHKKQRTWIIETNFKYPFLRFTEDYSIDTKTGLETIHHSAGMVANHVLVKLKPQADRALFAEWTAPFQAKVSGTLNDDLVILRTPGTNVKCHHLSSLMERLNSDNDWVLYAEPDHLVSALSSSGPVTEPDDPRYPDQNYLNRIDHLYGINTPLGWSTRTSAEGVVVAVIDSGVDTTHEDLINNLWTNPGEIPGNGIDDDENGFTDDVFGYDFINNDGDPTDDDRHGTHIAGIIGAEGNNGIGISGVAWDVEIMSLKFLDSEGHGVDSDAILSIQYAIANGAQILNNSWGGNSFSQSLKDAIAQAWVSDILFVAAAGNDGSDVDTSHIFPASYTLKNIISVGNLRYPGNRYSSSNYGALSVDLFAPGISALSTIPDSKYGKLTGTSQSAAVVTGIFALLKAEFPDDSAMDLRQRVFDKVYPLPGLSGLCVTGGRIDLDRCLRDLEPPSIQSHPEAVNNITGHSITLEISACGDGPLEYQWMKDRTAVPGATESSLTFESLTLSDAGNYSVVVTNLAGTIETDPALLEVSELPPTFVSQPDDARLVKGAGLDLSIEIHGSLPFTYQWYKDGTALDDSTESTFSLTDFDLSDAGTYQIVVTNEAGVTSSREISVSYHGRNFDFRETRYPYPLEVSSYTDVHYNNGKFIAVSGQGHILLSQKYGEWEVVHQSISALHDVTYDNGYWLAIGATSQVLVSRDGRSWESKTDGLDENIDYTFQYSASGNGKFVIAAKYYKLPNGWTSRTFVSDNSFNWATDGSSDHYSTTAVQFSNGLFLTRDGSHWKTSSTGLGWRWVPNTDSKSTHDNTYPGSDKFWRFSYEDWSNKRFQSSLDGSDWVDEISSSDSSTPGYLSPFAVIGDRIFYDSWQLNLAEDERFRHSALKGFKSMTFGNGRYVAVCNDRIVESADGINFVSTSHPVEDSTDTDLVAIVYGNGRYVVMSSDQSIWTSTTGTEWTFRSKVLDGGRRLDFSNGRFLVIGSWGSVSVSNDGTTWSKHSTNLPAVNNFKLWATEDRFWVEAQGNSSSDPKHYFTSTNGLHWTTSNVNFANGVTFLNDRFLALDEETLAFSPDGISWQEYPLPVSTESWMRVTFANDEYLLIAGGRQESYRSPDGIQWTKHQMVTRDAGTTQRLEYIGDTYVLHSWGLSISGDGVIWEKVLHGAAGFASSGTDLVAIGPGQLIQQIPLDTRFVLTTSTLGSGTIRVTPPEKSHGKGDLVMAEAIPSPGMVLAGWSGIDSSHNSTAAVTMHSDRVIQAEFREFSPGWRAQNFSPAEIEEGMAESWIDADGDGFSNNEEYLFATDPRSLTSTPRVQIQRTRQPSDSIALTFSRRKDPDLDYQIQICDDLKNWMPVPPENLQVTNRNNGENDTETVTVAFDPSAQILEAGFVRVRASRR